MTTVGWSHPTRIEPVEPGIPLPSVRTIQRWLLEHGLAPAPPGRRRATAWQRAQNPHDTWEIDAADQKRLANSHMISWLRVVDECSGAVLQTRVFPPRLLCPGALGWCTPISAAALSTGADPRRWSRQWQSLGLMRRSAHSFGTVADRPGHPSDWNPPRRPQDNGVVERSQGVASNWAEPDRCRNVAELQRRLNEEDRVQRELYPHGSCRSRSEAYPSLRHSKRPYSVAWEAR